MKARLWLVVVLLLLVLPTSAGAQGLQAPNRIDVVRRVAAACPGLILQDHAFTDAVATLLHQEDARWGRNGKRGNDGDLSHDAIAWTNPASPFGVSIVDIIGLAGAPDASPAWIDQTQETINQRTTGVWVRPSGRLPACLSDDGGTPAPPPVVQPPPPVDLTEVLVALSRIDTRLGDIETRLAALESRPAPSLDLFATYVDDMIGHGPGDNPAVVPNHVTDIKKRLDVIRVDLEQITAWLRSRSALRW